MKTKIITNLLPSFLLILIVFSIFALPRISQAVLVTCGVTDKEVLAQNPTYSRPCDFGALMDMTNGAIKFILFDLSLPIAAVLFFYAGFKMVTSGGSTEAWSKAKSIFGSTLIGLLCVAGAWLIIRTLLTILGYDGAWIGF